jgi:hypothetical protein
MLKSAAVLTIFLVLGVGGAASAAAPEDGFSCEYTNKAEVKAKEGSSGAPSGGAERGEVAASKQGISQFNFCDAYGSE